MYISPFAKVFLYYTLSLCQSLPLLYPLPLPKSSSTIPFPFAKVFLYSIPLLCQWFPLGLSSSLSPRGSQSVFLPLPKSSSTLSLSLAEVFAQCIPFLPSMGALWGVSSDLDACSL